MRDEADNTDNMLAAEAKYFLARGWSETDVARLLRVPIGRLSWLLAFRTGPPLEFIPSPAEIRAGMERFRPEHQAGFVSPVRSPAAILDRIIEFRPDPRDDKEDAA